MNFYFSPLPEWGCWVICGHLRIRLSAKSRISIRFGNEIKIWCVLPQHAAQPKGLTFSYNCTSFYLLQNINRNRSIGRSLGPWKKQFPRKDSFFWCYEQQYPRIIFGWLCLGSYARLWADEPAWWQVRGLLLFSRRWTTRYGEKFHRAKTLSNVVVSIRLSPSVYLGR
jgi:hypothetical protein